MARHLTYFDYKINQLKPMIGDLVEINFKGRKTIGIVRNLKSSSTFEKHSEILRIIDHQFEKLDIERIEKISYLNFISTSTLLYYIYNSAKYQKNKIYSHKNLLNSVSRIDLQNNFDILNDYKNLEISVNNQILSILNIIKQTKKQLLIIVPNESMKDLIVNILNKVKVNFNILYGQINYDNLKRIKKSWQLGNNRILVGGKKAVLLPVKNLESIIIIDPQSDDYAIVDQNPSIGIDYSAELLAKQHKAKLYRIGHSLDINLSDSRFIEKIKPKIVELSKQGEYTKLPLISKTSLTLAENALQNGKNVLFFLNRKGHAKHLKCTECHHIPFCGNCGDIPKVRKDDLLCESCSTEMWIPKNCPACHSEKLKKAGLGIKEIEKHLQDYFSLQNKSYIENLDVISEDGLRSQIYNFKGKKYDLVIDLLGDIHQIDSRFNANEKAVYKLKRFCHFSNDHKAECIIQTFSKININKLLNEEFYENELNLRKQLKLPPFSGIIELNSKNEEFLTEIKSKFELEKVNDHKYHISYIDLKEVHNILNKYPKEKAKNITVSYENSSSTQSES